MIFYISLAVLFAVLLLGVSLSKERPNRMEQLKDRLDLVNEANQREPRQSLELLRDDLLSSIPALNRWLGKLHQGHDLQSWLTQADSKIRPGKFLILSAGFGLLGGILVSRWLPWYLAVGTAFVFALVPGWFIGHKRTKRMDAFQAQFPEAIELLVRASRAGHPPSAALELISKEMPDPMASEFRQVFDQQRFGLPLKDCLFNLSQRMPLVDVQFFATAVVIQRESGGNLAEILEGLSSTMRERVKILREVKTHTAQGRMTMYLLLAMPPIMLLVMLGIARQLTLPMFTDPLGRIALGIGAGMQLLGAFLLNKIIQIKV